MSNVVRASVLVIPAQAGNQNASENWFPARAGMTWLKILDPSLTCQSSAQHSSASSRLGDIINSTLNDDDRWDTTGTIHVRLDQQTGYLSGLCQRS
jgi:hypothetical protein